MPDAGETLGDKYRLERLIARGGMGSVWRAEHLDLGMPVAVKFLRTDLEGADRPEERFVREARALARIQSPHVVHVVDFGRNGSEAYLVMEYLEGQDLALLLEERGALDPAQAISLIAQAARGLAAAHERGLVHRDLKPSNLFVCGTLAAPTVKLIDFGIAKQIDVSDGETTRAGTVLGSPAYMSPEQARGSNVGRASDVWSLSAVLYRMLTGERPFCGVNDHDLVVSICTSRVPRPSSRRAALGVRFDEFFARALSADAAERPVDLRAWQRELLCACADASELDAARREVEASLPAAAALGPTQPIPPAGSPEVTRPRGRSEATGSLSSGSATESAEGEPPLSAVASSASGRASETLSVAVTPAQAHRAGEPPWWRRRRAVVAASGLSLLGLALALLQVKGAPRSVEAPSSASSTAPGADEEELPVAPSKTEPSSPAELDQAPMPADVDPASTPADEGPAPASADVGQAPAEESPPALDDPSQPAPPPARQPRPAPVPSAPPVSATNAKPMPSDATVDESEQDVQEEDTDPIFGLPVPSP